MTKKSKELDEILDLLYSKKSIEESKLEECSTNIINKRLFILGVICIIFSLLAFRCFKFIKTILSICLVLLGKLLEDLLSNIRWKILFFIGLMILYTGLSYIKELNIPEIDITPQFFLFIYLIVSFITSKVNYIDFLKAKILRK